MFVHGVPLSPYVLKVLVFLEEQGLDVEAVGERSSFVKARAR